jgi:para-aminobenzoate synthetase / 4-amino-4-deoxychorismate lyase
MRYIAELEEEPRGAYCGAIGFPRLGARRDRFAVGIRTATVDLWSAPAVYGTGGRGAATGARPAGYDSSPVVGALSRADLS